MVKKLNKDDEFTQPPLVYRKSTFSSTQCLEVAVSSEHIVYVRNSRLSDRESIEFDADEWRAFILGVKAGEFDI